MVQAWWDRWRAGRRNSREALDEEMRFHIAEAIAAKVEAGMEPGAARRAVMVEFGGFEARREEAYRLRPGWVVETLVQDAMYALRGWRRNPGFAVTVIATFALAIGATTAVLSVVDPILFRPLPYAEGDRLVSVGLTAPIIPEEFMLGSSYYVWRDNQKAFSAFTSELGAYPCNLTERNPAHLNCAWVEGNFLRTLGVRLALGRDFLPEEDKPNGPKVAILSWSLWQSHYGGNADVVGRLIDLDGTDLGGSGTRVVGVLPKSFEMPTREDAEVLLPQMLDEAQQRKADPGRVLYAFGRLRPGMSVDDARRSLEPLFQYSLRLAPPAFRKEVHLRVRGVRERQMEDVARAAWMLLGTVLAVLLTACANIASLLLARGVKREREMALRSALGAARVRLVRQTITESMLLAAAGALVGWGVAWVLVQGFMRVAPANLPLLGKAHLDLRIAAFSAAIALVCGSGFGLLAALRRPGLLAASSESLGMRSQGSGVSPWMRRVLVAAQIAVCVVLLSASSLLVRSFWNLRSQKLGLETRGVMAVCVDLLQQHYKTASEQMEFFTRVEAALRRLPGVTAVGISDSLPPTGAHHESILNVMQVEGAARSTNGTGGMVAWRSVTPDYLHALGLRLVAGREFTEADRASGERLVILSRLLAQRLFAGKDPVGARIRPSPQEAWFTVAGVVEDVKNMGLGGGDEPEYYRLRRSALDESEWGGAQVFTFATELPTAAVVPWVRSQVAAIDPGVPLEVIRMEDAVKKLEAEPRFEAVLVGFFAWCGVVMAVIGLYGVIAFVVSSRTQEIGVRLALGAPRAAILRLVAGEGVRLIVAGSVVGVVAALGSARLLRGLLFGVGVYEPGTMIAAVFALALVALVATLVPAARAMRVDPVGALRRE